MNDIHIPSPCRLTNTQCNFQWVSKSQVTPDSYHSTLSLRDNHDCVFSSRVTLDSYHSTLNLCDNHDRVFSSRVTLDPYHSTLSLCNNLTVCFHLGQQNFSAYTASLLHPHRNFGISPRVSYTHTEISDFSTGLLHSHRNSG